MTSLDVFGSPTEWLILKHDDIVHAIHAFPEMLSFFPFWKTEIVKVVTVPLFVQNLKPWKSLEDLKLDLTPRPFIKVSR